MVHHYYSRDNIYYVYSTTRLRPKYNVYRVCRRYINNRVLYANWRIQYRDYIFRKSYLSYVVRVMYASIKWGTVIILSLNACTNRYILRLVVFLVFCSFLIRRHVRLKACFNSTNEARTDDYDDCNVYTYNG